MWTRSLTFLVMLALIFEMATSISTSFKYCLGSRRYKSAMLILTECTLFFFLSRRSPITSQMRCIHRRVPKLGRNITTTLYVTQVRESVTRYVGKAPYQSYLLQFFRPCNVAVDVLSMDPWNTKLIVVYINNFGSSNVRIRYFVAKVKRPFFK